MCGIIGIVSRIPLPASEAFEKLKRLEYRGYDSYGYYDGEELLRNTGEIQIQKTEKKIQRAILHTRWATHGNVTKENAHPHQSEDGNITIVHNGIIENYGELKEHMLRQGHVFTSQTDSEVIAHYFEDKLNQKGMKDACIDFMQDIKGEFALLVMVRGDKNIYALKRDSPLVLGVLRDGYVLASDIYAFSSETNKAVFFENEEYAIVNENECRFFDRAGMEIRKEVQEFSWQEESAGKEEYEHYMIKEIHEEPAAARRLLNSLEAEQKEEFRRFIDAMKSSKKIVFAACGTSYHAALLGVYYLHQSGKEAQALIGSEFRHFASIDTDTLVIFISQSGETMDLIEALKYAKEKGARIACMVNVPHSTIQRASAFSLNICAGQEICVAATKSFVNQTVLLLRIAQEFGYGIGLRALPQEIETLLSQEKKIQKTAQQIAHEHDIYILGRGLGYPIAREIALKMKEIAYVHAEGMMGGELKHGTIALIEQGTPVMGLIDGTDAAMLSNLKEVKARGAKVMAIANSGECDIHIQDAHEGSFAILAAIAGQLLTYYMAKEKGLPIDKPRNLAKSVTVK